jgi:hypothetical protein
LINFYIIYFYYISTKTLNSQNFSGGGVFQSKSELFSKKIQTLIFSCPPPSAAGRNKTEICSGGAGRKRGVGKMNSRPALAAAQKNFA